MLRCLVRLMYQDSIKSHILISSDIESEVKNLELKLKPHRVVTFIQDEFKLEDAKAVVAEAYISEAQTKYIILGAKNFNIVSQNSLLKIIEEPPRNIEFIIISPTKSNLLVTIRSRLPLINGVKNHENITLDIDLAKIDYADIFRFLKDNSKIKKGEAKELVESLFYRATVVDKLILSIEQLDNFDKAYRLLELNSRPQSVLSLILMGFVGER